MVTRRKVFQVDGFISDVAESKEVDDDDPCGFCGINGASLPAGVIEVSARCVEGCTTNYVLEPRAAWSPFVIDISPTCDRNYPTFSLWR
jgi:hypothetical protein